jgi:hypothetical protein
MVQDNNRNFINDLKMHIQKYEMVKKHAADGTSFD